LLILKEVASVDDLKAVSACAGLVPLRIGAVTVDEIEVGARTSLSPIGGASGLSDALVKAHGIAWPEAGFAHDGSGVRVVWFGHDEALLMGPAADVSLAAHAAVVDQSDAWAVVSVEGAGSVDVLARLVPVDLRDGAFEAGMTMRTQVGHLNASITKLSSTRFMVLVFRSMAATLIHDLKQAMAGVASRG
jgi:sarcosine oxidase subunit gamma